MAGSGDRVNAGVTVGYLPVGHDPSIAIVDDSGVLAVAEEERYSRVKNGRFVTDPTWFFDVLDEFGISPARVTCLSVPNIASLHERRAPGALAAVPTFGQARLVSGLINRVSSRLPNLEAVEYHRHHACHAASAYLASPFESAAVVTVDGMGESETASISRGVSGRLHRIESTGIPHSLGYLYQALAWWSGLTGGEREGKFMGLASWGKPILLDLLQDRFITGDDDGAIRIHEQLAQIPMTSAAWNGYVVSQLGPQRDGNPDHPDPAAADLAASIQVIVERVLLGYCRRARMLVESENLCLAGGVFMNTVANGVIQRSGIFDSVFVQPLASDNGLALGAALLSHRQRGEDVPRWVMTSAALGTSVSPSSDPAVVPSELVDSVAERILGGQVIGWVRGRAEAGARALGQRSVFADARDPATPERINAKLKRREKWRPFAPIMLEQEAQRWGLPPSPFMTFVQHVPDEVRAAFPAISHVDGTARLQTVGSGADPLLLALLERVRLLTGTGILLNTSLNGPGMPIVRTREEALDLLRDSDLDGMVVGDDFIDRKQVAGREAGCTCGVQFDVLLELSPREPTGHAHRHATTTHAVRLRQVAGAGLVADDLPAFDAGTQVAVAVPAWLDLLAEFTPRLVDWLGWLQSVLSSPLTVVDPAGRTAVLAELTDTGRPGPGGYASEIETFWLERVARWQV